jgi:tRNA-dihydrouridine synthase
VGIQNIGGEFKSMKEPTKIIARTNTDLIDVNFGYPIKKANVKV